MGNINKSRKFFIFLYVVMYVSIVSGYSYYRYANINSLDWKFSIWGMLSRLSGAALTPTLTWMLILMCRKVIALFTFRVPFFELYAAFDMSTSFHSILGWLSFSFVALHSVAEFFVLFKFRPNPIDLLFIPFWNFPIYTPYLTGLILLPFFAILSFFSTPFFQAKLFRVFKKVHFVLVPVVLLIVVWHGPYMGVGITVSLLFMILDRLLRYYIAPFSNVPLKVVNFELQGRNLFGKDVESFKITLQVPTTVVRSAVKWGWNIGDIGYFKFPAINNYWHPLVIGSPPNPINEEFSSLDIYIEDRGFWTKSVTDKIRRDFQHRGNLQVPNESVPLIRGNDLYFYMDGPHRPKGVSFNLYTLDKFSYIILIIKGIEGYATYKSIPEVYFEKIKIKNYNPINENAAIAEHHGIDNIDPLLNHPIIAVYIYGKVPKERLNDVLNRLERHKTKYEKFTFEQHFNKFTKNAFLRLFKKTAIVG